MVPRRQSLIVRQAAAHGYEVIVVGRRGAGLSKRLLGSCADKLLSSTRVPVLLVPSPVSREQARAVEAVQSSTG